MAKSDVIVGMHAFPHMCRFAFFKYQVRALVIIALGPTGYIALEWLQISM